VSGMGLPRERPLPEQPETSGWLGRMARAAILLGDSIDGLLPCQELP